VIFASHDARCSTRLDEFHIEGNIDFTIQTKPMSDSQRRLRKVVEPWL